jgi:hypothetical protein
MKEIKSIGSIIQLLQAGEFYSVSENVEIAKGKFEYQRGLKQIGKQFKRRILLWKK